MTIALTISTLASIGTAINAADVTTPDNELLAHINNILNGAQQFETIQMGEIATPSNPAATLHKLYFKSDGSIYTLNSAGTEVNIFSSTPAPDILQTQVFS